MTLPKTAYVLLWFPKPSETFVFREVMNLWEMGLPLKVFTLYGEWSTDLSAEMNSVSDRAERLGIPSLLRLPGGVLSWWRRDPQRTGRVLRTRSLKRWSGLERSGENIWAFLCAFHLARRFEEEGIEHIHAPWASGPATAAWIASKLTGIPFSFNARARDIFTRDRALEEKVRDAAFIRSETRYNITYLNEVCAADTSKIHLTYNGIPLKEYREADVAMKPPIRLSALGRFVGKKGYDYLLEGLRIVKDSGLAFHLTLAGDGPMLGRLQRLVQVRGLWDRVSFPGFIPYDRVSEVFRSTDIFLMPSVVHPSGDRDGIPTVILEALAHRVPVIASDVSGISEVVEDRVTGLLIRQKDPQAIAAAVWELAHDRQKAVEMAEQGRSRVLRQFDPETSHRRVLELYRQCLSRSGVEFRTTPGDRESPKCTKLGLSSFNSNRVQ